MKKKTNEIQCGDWHLGWGYSGRNKIGKLSLEDGIFTWTGRCQGRHGQKGSTYSVQFKLTEWYGEDPYTLGHDWIEYVGERTYGLPVLSELEPAVEALMKMTSTKTSPIKTSPAPLPELQFNQTT